MLNCGEAHSRRNAALADVRPKTKLGREDATTVLRQDCRNVLVRGDLEAAEVGFGLFEVREETLLGLKFAGVNAAASGLHADGMLEVQHLVVEQILNRAAWGVGPVKDAADHDGVVGRVVMAKHAAGMVGAPCEDRAPEKAVEETRIERIEDLVEVEVMT